MGWPIVAASVAAAVGFFFRPQLGTTLTVIGLVAMAVGFIAMFTGLIGVARTSSSQAERLFSALFGVLAAIILAIGALLLVVVAVSLVGEVLDDRAVERARTAKPVGTATFIDVFEHPGQYEGAVWRLEGIVPSEQRPRGMTVLEECIAPCGDGVRSRSRSLDLFSFDLVPGEVSAGDTVSVVCRVVGIREPGFLVIDHGYVTIFADVCRDWEVVENRDAPSD